MLATLVAQLSLNLTAAIVAAGNAYGTLPPITAATATTPIQITSTAHGVPPARKVHAVIAGVTGMVEANNVWVLSVVDANTFALSAFTTQGAYSPSVGVNAYVGGGTIAYAFPDYMILLGARNKVLSTAVATPRILFVPCDSGEWGLEPTGGVGQAAPLDPATPEVAYGELAPQIATEPTTFDVFVSGCVQTPQNMVTGTEADPDFGDFEATQALYQLLYVTIVQGVGIPRGKLLRSYWPLQLPANHPLATGTQSQRGQQWCGRFQFAQYVSAAPNLYTSGSLTFDVGTVPGGAIDDTIITIPS